MTARFGFVGLGRMGLPMALRLAAAGLDPLVYDAAAAPRDAAAGHGVRVAASVRALAAAADVIGVCVSTDAQVGAVCEGAEGLLAAARAGSVVAIHATVRPATIEALGRAAEARGIGLLDACVSGGESGAAAGTLVHMVGGAGADLERCRPLLEATGTRIAHAGPLGAGIRMKLCLNTLTYVSLRAAFEAHALARAAGLPHALLDDIAAAAGALSENMATYAGSLALAPDLVAPDALRERLAHYLTLADKDLAIALELAAERGVDLPVTRATADVMAEVYLQARRS